MADELKASHSPSRYLSIKWQTFAVISIVLVCLFAGYQYLYTTHSEKQFVQSRNNLYLQHKRQLDQLIEQAAQALQNLAHTSIQHSNLVDSLGNGQYTMLKKTVTELGWTLLVDAGVESVSVYDQSGDARAIEGGPAHADLIEDVLADESVHWRVQCQAKCFLEVGTPILFNGQVIGVLALSEPLSNIMLEMQRLARVDVGLLNIQSPRSSSANYVAQWGVNLMALTNPLINQSLFERIVQRFSLADLQRRNRLMEYAGQRYEVSMLPLAGNQAIVLSNITAELALSDTQENRNFAISLLVFLLAEASLILLLWRPLNRLKSSARLVPLLTGEWHSDAELREKQRGGSKFFNDESDLLAHTAVQIRSKISAMQEELSHREVQLHDRGKELEQQRDLLDQLLNSVGAFILILNDAGRIELANRTLMTTCGFSTNMLVGREFTDLLVPEVANRHLSARLDDLLAGRIGEFEHNAAVKTRAGDSVRLAWRHTVMYQYDNPKRQILAVAVDVSTRIKSASEMVWYATHDALTGMFNRTRFEDEYPLARANLRRYDGSSMVMVIEVESFKEVRQALGSELSDSFIERVADTIKLTARESDILAYVGEGRFAALLSGLEPQGLPDVVERYARGARALYLRDNEVAQLRFGIAEINKDSPDNLDLLSVAEKALLEAYQRGELYVVSKV